MASFHVVVESHDGLCVGVRMTRVLIETQACTMVALRVPYAHPTHDGRGRLRCTSRAQAKNNHAIRRVNLKSNIRQTLSSSIETVSNYSVFY